MKDKEIKTQKELADFFKKINQNLEMMNVSVELINLSDRKKIRIEDTSHPIVLESGKKYMLITENLKNECEVAYIKMY